MSTTALPAKSGPVTHSFMSNVWYNAKRYPLGVAGAIIMIVFVLAAIFATAQLGSTILTEASLSFLGLGVPEPYPSWGRMLSESAAEYVRTAPWLVIYPGLAISLVVFGSNLLGDALRDALDPRQRD